MTLKDLQKLVQSQQSGPEQSQLLQRLRDKPFWIWNREQHKQEDMSGDNNQSKKPDVDYLFYLSELAFAVELALAKAQEEHSIYRIKSSEDAYQVLTDKENLEMVLQQALKEEHMQYKDRIVELFTNMKDRIKVEDLKVY